jgi:hypothetical protein
MEKQTQHLHAEPENKERAKYGVVATIHITEDHRLRLALDDVCSDSDRWPQVWHSHWPFTEKDYDPDAFFKGTLSQADLAQIGLIIIARLSALTNNPQQ